MTTLKRLLRHPHAAVFDKSPVPELAFRLRHPNGATWSIAEGVLTAGDGSSEYPFDLAGLTVAQLADQLTVYGFEVTSLSPALAGLSALVLVEERGDQNESNGDHVFGFTSLLWALLTTYSSELREARGQIEEALRQMVMTQASGQWVDVWGTIYGFLRYDGESDASYAARLPVEAFRIRVNAHGIEQAILDATGADVRIEEPWKELFVLDQSRLSGPDRFYDGARAGYHLIQPWSRSSVDWPSVLPVIERNRAAGVLVLPPIVRHWAVIDPGTPSISGGTNVQHYAHLRYEDRALLDYSAIEEVSIMNYAAGLRREFLRSSYVEVPSQTWVGVPWSSAAWDAKYLVSSSHIRDYRVYYTALKYGGDWSSTRTWATSDSTWADFNPGIHSLHSRT